MMYPEAQLNLSRVNGKFNSLVSKTNIASDVLGQAVKQAAE